jgi:hypothetical protein
MDDKDALIAQLSARVARLEDVEAIRRLHYIYGYLMDYNRYAEVIDLFAEDGEAIFMSGVYKGRASLVRLYQTWLGEAYTHGKPGPIYGFIVDHHLMQEVITIADDRKTAKMRGRAYLCLGSHESRPDMPDYLPRQAYEASIYENTYVNDAGVWKIQRLEYALQWQALYEKGWTHTRTDLQPATQTYPDNPVGPDIILPEKRGVWPERTAFAFHYPNPVSGKPLD